MFILFDILGAIGSLFSIYNAIEGDSAKAKELRKTMKDFKMIRPGEKYHFSGTLSLVKTVFVVRDDGRREASRDCWTAPTADANHEYFLSKDFGLNPSLVKGRLHPL